MSDISSKSENTTPNIPFSVVDIDPFGGLKIGGINTSCEDNLADGDTPIINRNS